MSSFTKKLSILLLFFCAPAHTWAYKAPDRFYTEARPPKKTSGPAPYLSGRKRLSMNFFNGAPAEMKLTRESRATQQQVCCNFPISPYLTFSVGVGASQELYVFAQPCVFEEEANSNSKVNCVNPLIECEDAFVNRGKWTFLSEYYDYYGDDYGLTLIQLFDGQRNEKKLLLTSLSVHYVELLFPEFRLNTNRKSPESGWWISLGGICGIRLGDAKHHISYKKNNKPGQKIDINSFNLSDYRFGFKVQAGWNGISIFYTQAVTGLFKKGMGPQGTRQDGKIIPWSIGISFSLH